MLWAGIYEAFGAQSMHRRFHDAPEEFCRAPASALSHLLDADLVRQWRRRVGGSTWNPRRPETRRTRDADRF